MWAFYYDRAPGFDHILVLSLKNDITQDPNGNHDPDERNDGHKPKIKVITRMENLHAFSTHEIVAEIVSFHKNWKKINRLHVKMLLKVMHTLVRVILYEIDLSVCLFVFVT